MKTGAHSICKLRHGKYTIEKYLLMHTEGMSKINLKMLFENILR